MRSEFRLSKLFARGAFQPFEAPSATRQRLNRLARSVGVAVLFLCGQNQAATAATAPTLGAATSFAVLAATPNVNNTGPTNVTGDIGVSPAAAIVGFPPGTVDGTLHAADSLAASAQLANTAAYGSLAGQTCTTTFAVPTDLAGMTLVPGVYCFASSASNTGSLTLDAGGDASAVWVFKMASTLITGSGSTVTLTSSGQACNVFWQVGTSATLGTTTQFVGSILALTSITLQTGATLSGRALAQTGTVTLDSNNVSVCTLAPIVALVNPTITKAFSPTTIAAGAVSTLTITLFNANASVATLTAALIDALPPGLVIAQAPNGITSCGGGTTLVATAGANTLTLPIGSTIPANGSCTFSVSVTAPVAGIYINTLAIAALQTSNGNNLAPTVATLTVLAQLPPTVTALEATVVPTLSAWMLIMLSVALSVFGFAWVRNRAR